MIDSNYPGGLTDYYYYDNAGRIVGHYQPLADRRVNSSYATGNNRKETMAIFQGNTTNGTPLVKWTYAYEPSLNLDTINEQLGSGANDFVASFNWKLMAYKPRASMRTGRVWS
jgi:hypothetical protein